MTGDDELRFYITNYPPSGEHILVDRTDFTYLRFQLHELYRTIWSSTSPSPSFLRCERFLTRTMRSPRCRSAFCLLCNHEVQWCLKRRLSACLTPAWETGLGLQMVTLTLAHRAESHISDLFRVIKDMWRRCREGGAHRSLKRMGLLGIVNVVQATFGNRGGHPHIHAVAFAESKAAAVNVAAYLKGRFESVSLRAGLPVTGSTVDCREVWKPEALASYLAPPWSNLDGSPFSLLERALKGDLEAGRQFFGCHEAMSGIHNGRASAQLKRRVAAVFATAEESGAVTSPARGCE